MKPAERHEWIKAQLSPGGEYEREKAVDVLNRYFVDDYVAATGAKIIPTNWGADHCAQLGRDLSAMSRRGILSRRRIGLSNGNWQPGFPKWVWCYALPGYWRSPEPR